MNKMKKNIIIIIILFRVKFKKYYPVNKSQIIMLHSAVLNKPSKQRANICSKDIFSYMEDALSL